MYLSVTYTCKLLCHSGLFSQFGGHIFIFLFTFMSARTYLCIPNTNTCCSYLDDTLSHLLNCLKRERERPTAFQAIGLIAVSVQADINKDLPRIMDVTRASLPSRELPQKYAK